MQVQASAAQLQHEVERLKAEVAEAGCDWVAQNRLLVFLDVLGVDVLEGGRIASTDRRHGGATFRTQTSCIAQPRARSSQELHKAQRTAALQDAAGASAELQQQVENLKAEAAQAAKRVRSKWSCRRREMGQTAMRMTLIRDCPGKCRSCAANWPSLRLAPSLPHVILHHS